MSSIQKHTDPFRNSARDRAEHIRYVSAIFSAAQSWPTNSASLGNCLIEAGFFNTNRGKEILRPVNAAEIDTLKHRCNCKARGNDWSRFFLLYQPELEHSTNQGGISEILVRQVSDTCFAGIIVLGLEEEEEPTSTTRSTFLGGANSRFSLLPIGAHRNGFVANCVFEAGCCVMNNSIIYQTYFGKKSVMLNCGTVSRSSLLDSLDSSSGSPFSVGNECKLSIELGPETGGRKVELFAESTLIDVARALKLSPPAFPMNAEGGEDIYKFASCSAPVNIFHERSYAADCPSISNVYLSEGAFIDAASHVQNVTLLPEACVRSGSIVKDVLLQWKAVIENGAHVNNSLLMECSTAETASIVNSSVIGPDSHVGGGETQHTLLGPNANAHHQSLMIGVIWPLGRGNVGYGANVGSNHTGRTADQECWSGEGLFWGLSTVIKFPIDTTHAPYSLIAAGVNLPPQRLLFPFSLIVNNALDNHIHPGWVLSNSAYTIARNEDKFATRRKAKRHSFYTGWKIIRPETIDLCIVARELLRKSVGKNVYIGDKDVNGIGKCALSEKSRISGIEAYTEIIQLYSLRGLLRQIEEKGIQHVVVKPRTKLIKKTKTYTILTSPEGKVSAPLLPWDEIATVDAEVLTEHQDYVVAQEFPKSVGSSHILDLLWKLIDLEFLFAKRVAQSKSKDDYKGKRTIPGYADAHVKADDDKVVVNVRKEAARVKNIVTNIIFSDIHKISRL